MNGIEKEKEDLKLDIIKISGLDDYKIRNIYIYGSRVYGTHTINSDYDAVVIACSMYVNHEINDGTYNIHITTPDSFQEQLENHDIHCLECIYAPQEAQIITKINYLNNFQLDIGQLKKMILSQSAWAWSKAEKRIEKGNIIGGAKSLFHSLRILNFGLQIIKYEKIADFQQANHFWNEIKNFNGLEWQDYQNKWRNTKKQLMKLLKCA